MKSKLDWSVCKSIVLDDTLYKAKLNRVREYIKESSDILKETYEHRSAEDRVVSSAANTVVGVIGERGTGKTSFLHTLRNSLPDGCFCLGIVDPSNFESDMGILELFLVQLYSTYNKLREERAYVGNTMESPRFHAKLKKLAQILNRSRVGTSVYDQDSAGIDVLDSMTNLVEVGSTINGLCSAFLDYVNQDPKMDKHYLALLVDDVDMIENKKVFRLLEEIRKYLSGNIVVVIAYRERQLNDSILEQKLEEYTKLRDSKLASESEIQNQIQDFIEKVIPLDRTVRLMSQKELLQAPIVKVGAALGGNDEARVRDELISLYDLQPEIDVKTWIDEVVYRKTFMRVAPINAVEETVFTWPRNLREVLAYIKFLQVDLKDASTAQEGEKYKGFANNLGLYKDYILGRLAEALTPQLYAIVEKVQRVSFESKNYAIYTCLSRIITTDTQPIGTESDYEVLSHAEAEKFKSLLDASLVMPENVTAGDVSAIVNYFVGLNYGFEELIHLAYSLKVLYSLDALDCILGVLRVREDADISQEDKAKIETSLIRNYISLINACIIPPEPEASPLSMSALFLKKTPAWEEFARHTEIKWTASDEEIARVFAILTNTEYTYSRINPMYRSSAVMNRRRNKIAHSRPRRGDSRNSGNYSPNDNRPLFLRKDESDLQWNVDGMSASLRPRSLMLYLINIFNVLGDRWYVERSLDAIVPKDGVSSTSKKSAYIFYSLFDLDVFNLMQLDQKSSARFRMEYQLKRINTALVFSFLYKDGLQNITYDDDSTIMPIKIPFEQQRVLRLHTPFVLNSDYRLYGKDDAHSAACVSFATVCQVYELVFDLERAARFSPDWRLNPAVTKYLEKATKYPFVEFAEVFASQFEGEGEDDEAVPSEVKTLIGRLRQPNTKPSGSERQALMDIASDHPFEANRAFGLVENE